MLPRAFSDWRIQLLVHGTIWFLMFASAFLAINFIRLPPTNLTVIWFPAGLALAAMISGLRWWALPTIWLANWSTLAFLNGHPFFDWRPDELLICMINTLQPAIGYLVWRYLIKKSPFASGSAFLQFTAGVALLPALVTGWMIPAVVAWSGNLPDINFSELLLRSGVTILSNALGVFLLLPLLFSPLNQGLASRPRQQVFFLGLVLLASLLTCWLGFHGLDAVIFLSIPVVLLGGILSGARGAALSVFVISIYGLLATARGEGIFAGRNPEGFLPLFEMTVFAFALGIPGQFAGITLDQLRRQSRKLGSLVDQRTSALKAQTLELAAAKEAAESADQAKTDFLAAMSHEIRTPMNSVLGFARLLETETDPHEQQEHIKIIVANGEIFLALISDILDLSKIEAGAVVLERVPFDLDQCLHQIHESFSRTAADKGLHFSVELAPGLETKWIGDRVRFAQVLTNLISNAIKFTEQGSVDVDVFASPDQKFLTVRVADTGIGISPEQQSRLFQRFSQADSSVNRRYGGSGLGLVIARGLCESMGGELIVSSSVGQGTTFTATVEITPLGRSIPPVTGPDLSATGPAQGSSIPLRILVAEDNASNRRLIRILLERHGHQVEFACNGHEAVSLATTRPYDLIMMDIQMPDLDGRSAAIQIRTQEKSRNTRRIPIIAVTADALTESCQACLDAGMDDFITKPLHPEQLSAILDRVTRLHVS